MKVLFVCTGNICRSLTAAVLCAKLAKDKGLDWQTRSAGVAAESYYRVPREVRNLLKDRIGADVSDHKARLITEDWVDWADRIYVMEEGHRRAVVHRFPQAQNKTRLLDPAGEVADPYGKDAAVYAASFDTIQSCLERLLNEGEV